MDLMSYRTASPDLGEISSALNAIVEKWRNEVRPVWDLPYHEVMGEIRDVMSRFGYEFLEEDGGWDTPIEMAILLFACEDPERAIRHPLLVVVNWDVGTGTHGERTEWIRSIQVVRVD